MRPNPLKFAPEAATGLMALHGASRRGGLSEGLLQLVETRVSQLNGCAFCIDLHVKAALDGGEDPQRLHLLPAWRDSALFDDTERLALEWAEALTLPERQAVTDALYDRAEARFGEAGLAALSVAVSAINAWNRLMGPFQVRHPKGMEARLRV